MESNQIIVFFSSHMPSFGLNSYFFIFQIRVKMINVSPINVLHFLTFSCFISFFYFDLHLSVIIFLHCNVEIALHHFFLILWLFQLKSAFFMGYFCFHLSHLCNLCRYFPFVKYIRILTYLSNFAIFISFWSEGFIHDIFIYLI